MSGDAGRLAIVASLLLVVACSAEGETDSADAATPAPVEAEAADLGSDAESDRVDADETVADRPDGDDPTDTMAGDASELTHLELRSSFPVDGMHPQRPPTALDLGDELWLFDEDHAMHVDLDAEAGSCDATRCLGTASRVLPPVGFDGRAFSVDTRFSPATFVWWSQEFDEAPRRIDGVAGGSLGPLSLSAGKLWSVDHLAGRTRHPTLRSIDPELVIRGEPQTDGRVDLTMSTWHPNLSTPSLAVDDRYLWVVTPNGVGVVDAVEGVEIADLPHDDEDTRIADAIALDGALYALIDPSGADAQDEAESSLIRREPDGASEEIARFVGRGELLRVGDRGWLSIYDGERISVARIEGSRVDDLDLSPLGSGGTLMSDGVDLWLSVEDVGHVRVDADGPVLGELIPRADEHIRVLHRRDGQVVTVSNPLEDGTRIVSTYGELP